MTRWLHLIGIGEDGLDGLSPRARAALDGAEALIGGARHLDLAPADDRPRHAWPSPMKLLTNRLGDFRPRPTALLCSGDPLWFGVATHALMTFGPDEIAVYPGASAKHLVCARMGWPMVEIDDVSVHGRPFTALAAHLRPGARLAVLCQDGETPAKVAALLTRQGYGASSISAFSHMDGPKEIRRDGLAADWAHDRMADLVTLAIECRPAPGVDPLALGPSLPDDAFQHDGKITKRETRAAALAKLGGGPQALLWDVGAGSGAVGIEWLRAGPWRKAYAIEPRGDRRARIEHNRDALGAPSLNIVDGAAPDIFADLPAPDAIFMGGGAGAPGALDAAFTALKPGGRLVAHALTLGGEAAILAAHDAYGGELARIAVSRAKPMGDLIGWSGLAPVTQWTVGKSW